MELRELVHHLPFGMIELSDKLEVVNYNKTFLDLLNLDSINESKSYIDTIGKKLKMSGGTDSWEAHRPGKGDSKIWLHFTLSPIPGSSNYLVTAYDITSWKDRESSLVGSSIVDPTSGLFNRVYLDLKIKETFELSKRAQSGFVFALIRIENLKEHLDSLGESEGLEVLKQIGETLTNSVRLYDSVCRYTANSFGIVMPMVKKQKVKEIAERLLSSLHQIIPLNIKIAVSPSEEKLNFEVVIWNAERSVETQTRDVAFC